MLFAKENYAERSLANVAPKPGLDNDDQEKVKMKKVKVETKKANVAPKPGLDNDDQEEKENCPDNTY